MVSDRDRTTFWSGALIGAGLALSVTGNVPVGFALALAGGLLLPK